MTAIARKAEHEGDTGGHGCHWPGCNRLVPPALWGCRRHWFTLPPELRRRIWAAYRPGQETSKTPSADYVAVARDVQAWIEAHVAEIERKRAERIERELW